MADPTTPRTYAEILTQLESVRVELVERAKAGDVPAFVLALSLGAVLIACDNAAAMPGAPAFFSHVERTLRETRQRITGERAPWAPPAGAGGALKPPVLH